MVRLILLLLFVCSAIYSQPRRILYVTHSAGFRHGSIEPSQRVLQQLAQRSGLFTVTATEDLSFLEPERLNTFDAVFFFTSGELALSAAQKQGLLDFVRNGKGFGGAHSATDTLYQWPEYGELIGGYFDGHPWVQNVRIDVEDASNPLVSHVAPSFELREEIYQHRNFSRANVRVLLTLDVDSVNLGAEGVNRRDGDFALAWVRPYGRGRVFYTALGHFDETWQDPRVQTMLQGALEWLVGARTIEAEPRAARTPVIAEGGVMTAGAGGIRDIVTHGSIVSIYGSNLTEGPSMAGNVASSGTRLAGSTVFVNGQRAKLLYAGPEQINVLMPGELTEPVEIKVRSASGLESTRGVRLEPTAAGFFTYTTGPGYVTLWMTGLGKVERRGELWHTVEVPQVWLNGAPAQVWYSGLAPGWEGLYQVNVESTSATISEIRLQIARAQTTIRFLP